MNPPRIQRIDWRRLGLAGLRRTLRGTGELLIRSGRTDRNCGAFLKALSDRVPDSTPRP